MGHTQDGEDRLLKIHTLGGFDIRQGGRSVFDGSGRSYKTMELFKYFLTFRGKRLLPETIIENLQPGNDLQDPQNVLRTRIFRLRKVLKSVAPDRDETDYFSLAFSNGYYIFELGERSALDIEEFEERIDEANREKDEHPDEAIGLYKQALDLYAGDYLAENPDSIWAVPARNHYHRLYLQALFRLLTLLKDKADYAQVIELCESVLSIDPYDEALHACFLEALLEQGQIKYALSHYEYTASLLSREMGVKPSAVMRNIYHKIQSYNDEKEEVNLAYIEARLDEDLGAGALMCDMDYFRFLYNARKRNSARVELPECVGLVTLWANRGYAGLEEAAGVLKEVLRRSLRRGDVFSFWNDTQALILLSGVRSDRLDAIAKRIRGNFIKRLGSGGAELSVRFVPIAANELPSNAGNYAENYDRREKGNRRNGKPGAD